MALHTLTEVETAAALQALAHPTRLMLVSLLVAGPAFQKQLQAQLALHDGWVHQSTLAHHLQSLWLAGLVSQEQRAQFVLYRLVPGVFEAVAAMIRPHSGRKLRTGYGDA